MSTELRLALKTLIVEACDKDCDPASITDDELLFGPEAPLQLDSLDALQVSILDAGPAFDAVHFRE